MTERELWIPAALPPGLSGFATTRAGGVSSPPCDGWNPGGSCGDRPEAVSENRRRLGEWLPSEPCWLQQVHGRGCIHLDDWVPGVEADAVWTERPGRMVAVLTADCLPILLADVDGRAVAATHAGWRGLVAGVIEATVEALPVPPQRLQAWIGPRICSDHYPVGGELLAAFEAVPGARARFRAIDEGRWLADLPAIAGLLLRRAGVATIVDSGICSFADRRFFSVRRDGRTGRTATLAWIEEGRDRVSGSRSVPPDRMFPGNPS